MNTSQRLLALLIVALLFGVTGCDTHANAPVQAENPKSQPTKTIKKPMLWLPKVEPQSGKRIVRRVVDADTLLLDGDERLRLIGVNGDEIGRRQIDPNSVGWQQTEFVFELLKADPHVRLEYDKERTDKYDRTLAYVWLADGRMLNRVLLETGNAKVMRIYPNTRYAGEFREIEAEAKRKGLGRWAD